MNFWEKALLAGRASKDANVKSTLSEMKSTLI
jgi:hypothetical protein